MPLAFSQVGTLAAKGFAQISRVTQPVAAKGLFNLRSALTQPVRSQEKPQFEDQTKPLGLLHLACLTVFLGLANAMWPAAGAMLLRQKGVLWWWDKCLD